MSKHFPQYDELDLPRIAREILEQWEAEDTFGQSLQLRKDAPPYVFYEGPPSANGLPGIHHVMARAIKDIFCRYQTQKGFRVERKAGWDTHGLPVELGVEKELGITKEDIGTKISVEEYNNKCREAVMRYTDVWNDLTRRIGFWLDLDHPYITYKTRYIECVWWLLKRMHEQGLLYKGFTIQPYSPAAGSGLSSHELNQPGTYRSVKDTSVVAMFKVHYDQQSDFLFNASPLQDLPPLLEGEKEGEARRGAGGEGVNEAGGEGIDEGEAHGSESVFILAWTTTPWTLPSNTALTVGPKLDYVRVRTFNPYTHVPCTVLLAKARLNAYFPEKNAVTDEEGLQGYKGDGKNIPWMLLDEFPGKRLEGIRYEQLLPYAQPKDGDAFKVITGDFVTTEDGTGVVHTAPSFGADDQRVARQHGIGSLTMVDLQGRFTAEMGEFAGRYVKNEYYVNGEAPERSVDVDLAIKLKEMGRAFKVEKYEHNYPHCWRTDKPVLYYPMDSWFVRVTAKKDRLIALNKTITWKPESTGTGRFGNWLENLQDWNLSRSRFWGIPLPIWRSEDGKEEICIGSLAQLKEEVDRAIKAGFMTEDPLKEFDPIAPTGQQYDAVDLHKPHVDRIVLASPSGKPMHRENDLIDVWFDSGAMPYAQWGLDYEKLRAGDPRPFNEPFEESFPADLIAEGVDQTRGWFYTLHAIAAMVFDDVAYRTVISNGLVLDKNGQKMSKRLGNAVDPFATIDKYGPDAVRWYMISNAQPWDNLKFDAEGITEVQRKFFRALHNTYGFFALYANIDGFTGGTAPTNGSRNEMDKWIISRLNSLVVECDAAYSDHEPTQAARTIQDFVIEDLSNWYVRLNRRRYWKGEMGDDKLAAYHTLQQCLVTVAKLCAPIVPFFSDRLHRDLQGSSVHLSDWPVADRNAIDLELEERTRLAQRLTSLVLSIRKKEGHRVRQPLQKILVPVMDEDMRKHLLAIKDLVLSEVNVKELELLDPAQSRLTKKIKADFKKLGARLGKLMKGVANEVNNFGQEKIAELEEKGSILLEVEGQQVELFREETEITAENVPGLSVASEGRLTVALDITLTDELVQEGIARELVSRIQTLRKEQGLEVTDRIALHIKRNGNSLFENAIRTHAGHIRMETLAITPEEQLLVELLPSGDAVHQVDLDPSNSCHLSLERTSN